MCDFFVWYEGDSYSSVVENVNEYNMGNNVMKFQPLKPWIKGNGSVTPNNFYGNSKPCFEMGAFIALDIAVDLYFVNTVDTGNLFDSWHKNKELIEKACEIANVSEDNGYDLDNEEKGWILEELGEPPECCYNLYFITVYDDANERLVYIGKTDAKKSRFINGHLVALKLHNPKYNMLNKRVYFGTITFLSKENEYVPLEFITPYNEANNLLCEMEALLISHFVPELNVKREHVDKLKDLIVHIQNFSDVSAFLNDYVVYGC
ncbi:MAG: hypothetical protein H6Q69_1071 [Firmicutes bacterium]|nr:hypothetical protein [Bacillota bacterium]